ncbi:MAG: hypothetical protein GY799_17760 [Desulfobulbaceae bacterium]|nr:hypothetical protein [Desulfobulbaceae bacterium]
MPNIRPVVIEGNALARTWWGKSWNKNLERYADYTNRIGRGRSYVRHGAVLDLKIDAGQVTALVQGSTSKPYEVAISIKSISQVNWQEIKNQCEGQLKSLQDLLAGKFPKTLADIFFNQEKGLFPSPQTISFDCSCPDWASMCKHVAAALYGIGARFDEDPGLFFKLRGVKTEELIARAVKDKTNKLLAKTKKKSAKVLDDADLSDIFGIDMDIKPDFSGKTKVAPRNGTGKARKKKTNAKKGDMLVTPPRERQKQRSSKTATGLVAELIVASKTGISVDKLAEKTGYTKTKIYGIVHRLKKQGKITSKFHGMYESA